MSLKEFLETFTKNYNKQQEVQPSAVPEHGDVAKASKWTLLDLQRHNHPYDDRKGLVATAQFMFLFLFTGIFLDGSVWTQFPGQFRKYRNGKASTNQ